MGGNPKPVAGRYFPAELIGKGGMGEVWKAWDSVLARWVAVKIVPPHEWRHEDRTVARLFHPNIVPVYDAGVSDGKHYVAMQYIEGADLANRKLPPLKLAAAIRDAARGVGYAHSQGVIHRDLKPENILVDRAGHVYVTDFGLATPSGYVRGEIVGTPEFISPAQAAGRSPDARNDLYSLGASMRMLLGDRPPASLERIAGRCMAGRYVNAAALVDDLDAFLLNRARRRWAFASAAAILVAISLMAYLSHRTYVDNETAESWCRVGEQAIKDRKDWDAVFAFSKALDIKPAYRTYMFRSFAHWRLENYEETVKDLESAIRLEPQNPIAHRSMAHAKAARRTR